MITERGGTGRAGSILVITARSEMTSQINPVQQRTLPCVPTAAGIFGGASRMTIGGSVAGGGGRCPMPSQG